MKESNSPEEDYSLYTDFLMADDEQRDSVLESAQTQSSVENTQNTSEQPGLIDHTEDVDMGGIDDNLDMDVEPNLPDDFGNEFSESLPQDFPEEFGDAPLAENLPEGINDKLLSNLDNENGDADDADLFEEEPEEQNPANEASESDLLKSPSKEDDTTAAGNEEQEQEQEQEQDEQMDKENDEIALPETKKESDSNGEGNNDPVGNIETEQSEVEPAQNELETANDKQEPAPEPESFTENPKLPDVKDLGQPDSGIDAPVHTTTETTVDEEIDKEHNTEAEAEPEVDSILEQESRSASPESNITVKQESNTADPKLFVPQSHEIVIPSYSKWFNLTKVHEIEVKSLPEFFTNRIPSKTPQMYVKYRNFMVNSYRLNPNEYFTVTAARRNLCGDAGALFRLHKFLTKWGLINYQVNATKKPKMVEPPFTGEYETRYDAPRGLFPFQSYKPALQLPDMTRLKKIMTQLDTKPSEPSSLKRTSDEISSEHTQDLSNGGSSHVNGITNKTASGSVGPENYGLKDERESPVNADLERNDRKPKRPKISQLIDKDWTQEEIYKLIELIKEHGTDWFNIAKTLGTKTPEQCILRFLQLPIEDAFLMDEKDLGLLKFGSHIPFNKSDNPVMSTLAFLIGLVDPNIVQHLTKRAISLHDINVNTGANTEAKDAEERQEEQKEEQTEESKEEQKEEIKTDAREIEHTETGAEKSEPANSNAADHSTATEGTAPAAEQVANSDVTVDTSNEKNANTPENEEKEATEVRAEKTGEEGLQKAEEKNKEEGSQEEAIPVEEPHQEESLENEALSNKETPSEKQELPEEQAVTVTNAESDARITVKDGTEVALATLGLRSHVFATNQEKLMNRTTNDLINTQLTKVDLKLKALDTMEKSLELERKAVHRKQEDVFIQRLSFTKYANSLMGKFESLLKQIPESPEIKQQLHELRTIIADPPKTSITSQSGNLQDSDDLDSANKPISIESPQLYRYWSG